MTNTASVEKHAALRNAALNCALQMEPEADLLEMFLRYLSDFTPMHVKLLTLLNDPYSQLAKRGISRDSGPQMNAQQLIDTCLPELAEYKATVEQVIKELGDRGLVQLPSLDLLVISESYTTKMTTDLGQRFVGFMSDPLSWKAERSVRLEQ